MTAYRNFTVDFPRRVQDLDMLFAPLAKRRDLDVTYLLMKTTSAFLLPYERTQGESGARKHDVRDPQSTRTALELDKLFIRSSYCNDLNDWREYVVDDFSRGPVSWIERETRMERQTVARTLLVVRHALAHSNLYFGGEGDDIEHVYFGSRAEKDKATEKYKVVRGSVADVERMLDTWLICLQRLRTSNALVWQTIEQAA